MNNIKLMIDGINCSSVIINPNAIDQYYDNSNSVNISSNNIQNVIEEIDNHITDIKIDINNTKEYVDNKISTLIGTVPETLDTLEEISNVIQNNTDTITILNEAIGNKANKIHNHTISDISNFPTSLPASDVYSWAKSSTKPTYTYNEVGADASGSAATALTNANAYTNTKINELNGIINSVDQSRGGITNGADIEKLSNGTYQTTPDYCPSCGIPSGFNSYGSVSVSGSGQYPNIEYLDVHGNLAKWDHMSKAWKSINVNINADSVDGVHFHPTDISGAPNGFGYVYGFKGGGDYHAYVFPTTQMSVNYSNTAAIAHELSMPRWNNADANHLPSTERSRIVEFSNSSSNLPSAHWYHIWLNRSADTNYGSQLALGMTTNDMYYRSYQGGGFSGWQRVMLVNDNKHKIQLREDSEGANIRLISPDNHTYEIDTEGNSYLRVYGFASGEADSDDMHFRIYRSGQFSSHYTDSNSEYFRPRTTSMDNTIALGTGTRRFKQLHAGTTTISTSDKNLKDNIKQLTDIHYEFFMKLIPVSFTFIDGTSGRTHIGFIAQDVEQTMSELGLTDLDFAGLCKDIKTNTIIDDETGEEIDEPMYDDNGNPQYLYSLRYSEFIGLITHAVQRQNDKISTLSSSVENLVGRINLLEQLMDI